MAEYTIDKIEYGGNTYKLEGEVQLNDDQTFLTSRSLGIPVLTSANIGQTTEGDMFGIVGTDENGLLDMTYVPNSGVTAGTYGGYLSRQSTGTTEVFSYPVIQVDRMGRIISAQTITIDTAKANPNGRDGVMTIEDKTKLDGIEEGAQENVLEGIQVNGTNLTISSKKVNIPVMTGSSGSTPGKIGLVPQPTANTEFKFLTGNGKWLNVDINTTDGQSIVSSRRESTYDIDITVTNASSTKSGLMASSDKTKLDGIADYVIEQGTSNGWNYKKYHSGSIEAWSIRTTTLTSYVTLGNFAGYSWTDIPTPFTMGGTNYTIEAEWKIGSGFAISGGVGSQYTTKFQLLGLGSASGSQSCTVCIHLFGS